MNNGGPAFPQHNNIQDYVNASGMTLRDYFAAKALQGYTSHWFFGFFWAFYGAARAAYQEADDMLKAREQ